jgi:L-amino acid N-acyltransferase YncA
VDRLDAGEARAAHTERDLANAGITVRALDLSQAEVEITRIFRLSLDAFADNFLYTPIGREEFLLQYRAVLPHVRPELVLMAERGGELVGFMFALPNILESRAGGRVDTVILKTLAVAPSARGAGLGTALLVRAQRTARQLGFRRAIHALIHERNLSRRISEHYARTIRQYALLQKRLVP